MKTQTCCSPREVMSSSPATCSENEHILGYFYIISLEGDWGAKSLGYLKNKGAERQRWLDNISQSGFSSAR